MPRNLIPGDATIKAAVARALRQQAGGEPIVPRQLRDGDGLYLLLVVKRKVAPAWRFDFSGAGVRKTLSLGTYPDAGLGLARKKADELRKIVADGRDPSQERKASKDAQKQVREATKREAEGQPPVDSFESVAREFHGLKASGWSPRYAERWLGRMEKDLFPAIGRKLLPDVGPKEMLRVLQAIEARSSETAHTLLQTAGMVFRFGIQTERCERNPCADLRGALTPVIVQHQAAITDPAVLANLLRAIDAYPGQPTTRGALLLSALTFQRPYNVRAAEWKDIDTKASLWSLPAAVMKRRLSGKQNGRPHLVPLAKQAIAVLEELRPLTGAGRLLFPGLVDHDRPLSENTVNLALRRMGFDGKTMSAHGFRATARTLLVERVGVDPEVVEAQLAHEKSGPLGAAYNRAQFMEQRRTAMQKWADYLDRLKSGGNVMPIRAA